MNRRGFIQAAALSGAALGAAALLGGCAPTAQEEGVSSLAGTGAADVSWDKEVDVLVIGSGTGAVAALVAADLGAESVCLLEKSVQWGGTSATSGGGVSVPLSDACAELGIEDSKEEVIKHYRAASEGRADEAILSRFIDNGNDWLRWTTDKLGWKWTVSPVFGDYYEPLPGWLARGRGSLGVLNEAGDGNLTAAEEWEQYRTSLEADGVEILMETAAERLVTDDSGAVVGVVASQSGTTLNIRARTVIMATGGFEHNDDMRARFLPYKLLSTCSCPTNTGDGHAMGTAIGATLSFMDHCFGTPAVLTTGDDPQALIDENRIAMEILGSDWAVYRNMPGAVVVNKKGRRIGNEACAYDPFNLAFKAYDTGTMEHVNLPAYLICDSACWNTYSMPGHAGGNTTTEFFDAAISDGAQEDVPAWFVKADTLEELAEKLGIDPVGLADEMAAFNRHAAEGRDPVWHRGERQFDLITTGTFAGNRTDIANPCLAPVEVGPFYGAVYVSGSCGTAGGLTINEFAQVLRGDGEPIENLYAIGCCSASITGGTYCNGGVSLGSGSVMGWIAVHHALGLELK